MAARLPLGTRPVRITVDLPPALYNKVARIVLYKNSNLDTVIIEMLKIGIEKSGGVNPAIQPKIESEVMTIKDLIYLIKAYACYLYFSTINLVKRRI